MIFRNTFKKHFDSMLVFLCHFYYISFFKSFKLPTFNFQFINYSWHSYRISCSCFFKSLAKYSFRSFTRSFSRRFFGNYRDPFINSLGLCVASFKLLQEYYFSFSGISIRGFYIKVSRIFSVSF